MQDDPTPFGVVSCQICWRETETALPPLDDEDWPEHCGRPMLLDRTYPDDSQEALVNEYELEGGAWQFLDDAAYGFLGLADEGWSDEKIMGMLTRLLSHVRTDPDYYRSKFPSSA